MTLHSSTARRMAVAAQGGGIRRCASWRCRRFWVWVAGCSVFVCVATLARVFPFGHPQWHPWVYHFQASVYPKKIASAPSGYTGRWRSWDTQGRLVGVEERVHGWRQWEWLLISGPPDVLVWRKNMYWYRDPFLLATGFGESATGVGDQYRCDLEWYRVPDDVRTTGATVAEILNAASYEELEYAEKELFWLTFVMPANTEDMPPVVECYISLPPREEAQFHIISPSFDDLPMRIMWAYGLCGKWLSMLRSLRISINWAAVLQCERDALPELADGLRENGWSLQPIGGANK